MFEMYEILKANSENSTSPSKSYDSIENYKEEESKQNLLIDIG